MTDATVAGGAEKPAKSPNSLLASDERTKKRNAAEKRFQMYGAIAISAIINKVANKSAAISVFIFSITVLLI